MRHHRLVAGRLALTGMSLVLAVTTLVWPAGCTKDEKPRKLDAVADAPNPLPSFLRGTVRYEAELTGFTPQLISGYGLVVGLEGTGSSDTPMPVRAYMEKQANKLLPNNQIGGDNSSSPFSSFSKLHDSKDTAVVLVQAIVPPGAVKGTHLDAQVTAVAGTSTSSLEGGRLWTTDLRMGLADPSGPTTITVGQAIGDLFINPFAAETPQPETNGGIVPAIPYFKDDQSTKSPSDKDAKPPTTLGEDTSSTGNSSAGKSASKTSTAAADSARNDSTDQSQSPADTTLEWRSGGGQLRSGRILNGCTLLTDMPLGLQLRSASFSRSRAITDAINSRFPQEPGQDRPTAEPVSRRADEEIRITVPPSYSKDTEAFAQILMNTQIAQGGTVERALQLSRWVQENPVDAGDVTWCWVALGPTAIEGFSSLYNAADVIPRFAALNAGARLGDSRAIQPLVELAEDPHCTVRNDVIKLLGDVQSTPNRARIGVALRKLLDDPSKDIRVSAFNALVKQDDPTVRRVVLDPTQGFDVYSVPSKYSMVYATRAGQPMIVVFGSDISILKPSLSEAMSGRFILSATGSNQPVRVQYRPTAKSPATVYEPSDDLVRFVSFLGAKPSRFASDPGLGLSYAETVRALFAMERDKAIAVPFVPQTDYWTQQLLAGQKQAIPEQRPIDSSKPSSTPGASENIQPVSGARTSDAASRTSPH